MSLDSDMPTPSPLFPSMKVCERSLSGTGAGPNAAAASQFVRAETFPSGYLIRPCDGGGSIIHIVDHLSLEVISLFLLLAILFLDAVLLTDICHLYQAWSVPEVLRPLYESSKVLAQKTTIAVRTICACIIFQRRSRVL